MSCPLSNFNCCTALDKSLRVGSPFNLIKKCLGMQPKKRVLERFVRNFFAFAIFFPFTVMSQSIPTGYIPPGQPPGKFF